MSFTNDYIKRQVAQNSAKACFICYKPSDTVLVSRDKGDFFYVCPGHLLDAAFCEAIYPDDYNELKEEREELKGKVQSKKIQVDAEKPFGLSKLMSTFLFTSSANSESDKKDDKKDEPSKSKSQETKYKQYAQELAQYEAKLKDVSDKVLNFNFKNYRLNQDIFKKRLTSHSRAQISQKRQQEIHKPGFFPDAPSNKIGSLNP